MKATTLSIFASTAVLMAGCAYEPLKKSVDEIHADTEALIRTKNQELVPDRVAPRPVFKRVSGSWLGSKAVPIAQEAKLPPAFTKDVTFIFPGRVGIRTVAERITKVTGIPVALKPDVFTSAGGGSPMPAMPIAAPGGSNMGLPPLPGMGMLGAGAYQTLGGADEIELNYTGPLIDLLNLVASRFGINWEYSEVNGIMYSRMVTRNFQIKANPGDASFTASLGKGGSSGSGTNSGFSADGQVKMNSAFSVWDGIQKALESIKSPAGKFHISQSTGAVTMTDTKDVVDMAEKIINMENAMLTKQVAIKLEMYSVTSQQNVEAGVDWNLIYTTFSNLVPQMTLSLLSPATLTTAAAGSLGMSVIAPSGDSGWGKWNGSEAFIRALQGTGKVARLQTVSAMTLNRQPVPIGVTNQQSYLARTTAGTGGTGGVSLSGLEPGQVTTGFLANFLPTVLDNNNVLLQFSIDLSELQKIGSVSTGSGATQQMIQTPDVNGVQFVQRVALRAGSTLVLTGYERDRYDYDQNGLTSTVGLGGSIVGNKKKESIVIMITPVIVDGA